MSINDIILFIRYGTIFVIIGLWVKNITIDKNISIKVRIIETLILIVLESAAITGLKNNLLRLSIDEISYIVFILICWIGVMRLYVSCIRDIIDENSKRKDVSKNIKEINNLVLRIGLYHLF